MQIYMKPELEWKLRAYNKKSGVPMSQLVGELLEDFLSKVQDEPRVTAVEPTA